MKKDISLKTSVDILHQRKVCKLIEQIFIELDNFIKPGITTDDINLFIEKILAENKAASALKGYRGFPKSVCTSVNNVAAHGIPSDYSIQKNDVVSVDLTVIIDGWYGDGAWTYIAGEGVPDRVRLVKAAWNTTMAGITAAKAGGRMGDIGYAIHQTAQKYGCTVLEDFVGHGIGTEFHEEPMVFNIGCRNAGIPIVPGMVITIEPIVCLGKPETKILDDGWSIVTQDGSLCAQFEHTIAVFGHKTEILTLSEDVLTKASKSRNFYS
ncbi:MAG: type I methionyl aminopeptidase [Spirochaetota bacterium]